MWSHRELWPLAGSWPPRGSWSRRGSWSWSWLCCLCLGAAARAQDAVTAQGRLRGVPGDGFTSYLGIPYGNVSENGKFQRAETAPTWSDVREPQPLRSCAGSALACLTLDVHAPAGPGPRAVLVWLHAAPARYHPAALVRRGILVVNVYYRDGPYGFLCLGNEKVPGNAGAKDVVLALRWVRDNIVAFGGTPSMVVVAGQGFGGAIVQALLLSPMAQGLFHGAIIQSGSILSPWAFNYDAKERASALAEKYTNSDDREEIVSAFLDADVEDLTEKAEELMVPYFPFSMCQERALDTEESFLLDAPINLMTNKAVQPVPVIIGYNSNEGFIFASNLVSSRAVKRLSRNLNFLIPEELVFLNNNEVTQTAKRIKDVYFKNNLTMRALISYHGDVYFVNHVQRSARLLAAAGRAPVYYYQFRHESALGVQPDAGVGKAGAAHADELAFLFPEPGRGYEGPDAQVHENIVTLWTNFVKFQDPTPDGSELAKWEPLSPYSMRQYRLGPAPASGPLEPSRAAALWDDLYDKHYYRRHKTS